MSVIWRGSAVERGPSDSGLIDRDGTQLGAFQDRCVGTGGSGGGRRKAGRGLKTSLLGEIDGAGCPLTCGRGGDGGAGSVLAPLSWGPTVSSGAPAT